MYNNGKAKGVDRVIAGIGVDMVSVERMKESLGRESFVRRVFSKGEQALFEGRSEDRAAERAAGCFAAKEAFLKAVGKGLGGFGLADIAALRKDSGAPYFAFTGAAAGYLEENGLTAHLSLTHDGGFAAAFVVLEKKGTFYQPL